MIVIVMSISILRVPSLIFIRIGVMMLIRMVVIRFSPCIRIIIFLVCIDEVIVLWFFAVRREVFLSSFLLSLILCKVFLFLLWIIVSASSISFCLFIC